MMAGRTSIRYLVGIVTLILCVASVFGDGEGESEDKFYHDCKALKASGVTASGVYDIYPGNEKAIVYCDMDTDGGGWTVIQRHRDGNENFTRNWIDYGRGFGKRTEDHWLGNQVNHRLTNKPDTSYTLRVEIETWSLPGEKKYAEYKNFEVKPHDEYFQISFSDYSGNAGDSLKYHNNSKFSTYDMDKDEWMGGNYAKALHSGWWFGAAVGANLNGQYYPGQWDEARDGPYKGGIWWTTMVGFFESVRSEMKIRDDSIHQVAAS